MVIGIIGETGSGKSTVAKLLEQKFRGCFIEADKIGHELYKNERIKQKLIKHFGNIIIEKDDINRKKLGKIVLNDKKELEYLNNIMFDEIKKEIIDIIENKGYDFYIIDAALLIQANMKYLCDNIIYIYADEDIRKQRLLNKRGIDIKRVEELLKNTKHSEFYVENSDAVFDLSNGYESVIENIYKYIVGVFNEKNN